MMGCQGRFCLASAEVACEEFDGEMVVLNLATGQYFALNHTATLLMTGLVRGHAVESLSAVPNATFAQDDAIAFFHRLVENELVVQDTSCEPEPITVDIADSIGHAPGGPTIDVHSDLADLIISDPVHETDEAIGWPVKKAA